MSLRWTGGVAIGAAGLLLGGALGCLLESSLISDTEGRCTECGAAVESSIGADSRLADDLPDRQPVVAKRDAQEISEARDAVKALFEENLRFEKENLDLRKQIHTLTDSLALEKARGDHWAVLAQRQDHTATGTVAGTMRLAPVVLLEVDRERMLAVIEAGQEDGVRSGMLFRVAEGRGAGARLRVVDVRPRVSGATIEYVETGSYPEAGDRAIPANLTSKDR